MNMPAREPDWREKLDIALDAMMVGNTEVSEAIFDELDTLQPDWQRAVPYARIERRARQGGTRRQRYADKDVVRVIATMCSWSGIPNSAIAIWLGVSRETVRIYIDAGEYLLDPHRSRGFCVGHVLGEYRTSYEMRYPGNHLPYAHHDLPLLEEDWPQADVRREARRAARRHTFERDHRMLREIRTVPASPGQLRTFGLGEMDAFYCSCGFRPTGQNPDDELAMHFANARVAYSAWDPECDAPVQSMSTSVGSGSSSGSGPSDES